MASALRNSPLLFSISLVVLFLGILLPTSHSFQQIPFTVPRPKHEKLTYNLLGIICHQTEQPSFCSRTLQNHTHIDETDVHQLFEIVLGLVNTTANDIYRELKTTGLLATNQIFFTCSENYKSVIDAVDQAYKTVSITEKRLQVFYAAEEAVSCGNQLKHAASSYASLREKNRVFQYLCNIYRVVSVRVTAF